MIKPEAVRFAKRTAAVLGAVAALGGVAYAAADSLNRAEDAQRRLLAVELSERKLEQDISRLEGKVDALLFYFRIPVKEPNP